MKNPFKKKNISNTYTANDVITCKEEADKLGLKEGMLVAVGDTIEQCVFQANNRVHFNLTSIHFDFDKPFYVRQLPFGGSKYCIILKENKYTFFNLSDKNTAESLLDRKVIHFTGRKNKIEDVIYSRRHDCWFVKFVDNEHETAANFLSCWTFEDGTPCGKETEK